MATTDTERIHTKSKHLTMEDRESLYQCLKRGLNLTDTAKYLHCDILYLSHNFSWLLLYCTVPHYLL